MKSFEAHNSPEFALPAVDESPVDIPSMDEVATACNNATAIGMTGLHRLTIDAARSAIKLAQFLKAKVFIQGMDHPAVRQDTTIAWLESADLVVGVGSQTFVDPAIAIPDTLSAVQQLRAQLQEDETEDLIANQIKNATRVCIALSPDCETHIVSQWHGLAGAMQTTTRIGVLQEPVEDAANLRGALEALTWLTGCSASTGGVDLSQSPARNCADLQTHLSRNAIDLLIEFGNPDRTTSASCNTLHLPGIVRGQSGMVMRFDGVTFELADEPASAQPDVAKQTSDELIERLTRA